MPFQNTTENSLISGLDDVYNGNKITKLQHHNKRCLPTITCQKIRSMICDSEIVLEKCESTVSTGWSPLLHFIRDTLQSAEKRDKHIPIQGIPNKPCTVEYLSQLPYNTKNGYH